MLFRVRSCPFRAPASSPRRKRNRPGQRPRSLLCTPPTALRTEPPKLQPAARAANPEHTDLVGSVVDTALIGGTWIATDRELAEMDAAAESESKHPLAFDNGFASEESVAAAEPVASSVTDADDALATAESKDSVTGKSEALEITGNLTLGKVRRGDHSTENRRPVRIPHQHFGRGQRLFPSITLSVRV